MQEKNLQTCITALTVRISQRPRRHARNQAGPTWIGGRRGHFGVGCQLILPVSTPMSLLWRRARGHIRYIMQEKNLQTCITALTMRISERPRRHSFQVLARLSFARRLASARLFAPWRCFVWRGQRQASLQFARNQAGPMWIGGRREHFGVGCQFILPVSTPIHFNALITNVLIYLTSCLPTARCPRGRRSRPPHPPPMPPPPLLPPPRRCGATPHASSSLPASRYHSSSNHDLMNCDSVETERPSPETRRL
jgi:hypothetical protein